MAWAKPDKLDYVEYMSPDDYLSKTLNRSVETYKPETYFDIKTRKDEPISKLSDYIKSKDVEVDLPYVNVDDQNIFGRSEHEGRHRVYSAKLAGEKLIKVIVPPPESWRSEDIKDEYVKRLTANRPWVDKEFNERLKAMIDRPFPSENMGLNERKVYQDILKEKGLLKEIR